MAIPGLLERAILKGWADFRTISHAFGTFGSIPIPKNATVIIVSVKWFPFINPFKVLDKRTGADITTWRDFFRYSEYQLKIDGKKSKNFLQFRNSFDYKWFMGEPGSINLDSRIDYTLFGTKFLPIQKEPIIQDVYFVCEQFCKLTITRNAYITTLSPATGLLAETALENNSPDGVKDMPLCCKMVMNSPGGSQMFYYPPNTQNSSVFIPAQRNTENYKQDYDKNYSGITEIKTFSGTFQEQFPYHTSPLVEFGIVTINNKDFERIKNS